MGVLHEADLEITKIDVSLESVMPEIIAPMTTALKDNLGHYGFNEDATINVIGEDEDIKLGSRMMLENNGIKQWDFSGHITKMVENLILVLMERVTFLKRTYQTILQQLKKMLNI